MYGRDLLGASPQSVLRLHARRCSKSWIHDSLIYDELALPLESRKIPMAPMMREQALAAFREWERSQTKIQY